MDFDKDFWHFFQIAVVLNSASAPPLENAVFLQGVLGAKIGILGGQKVDNWRVQMPACGHVYAHIRVYTRVHTRIYRACGRVQACIYACPGAYLCIKCAPGPRTPSKV